MGKKVKYLTTPAIHTQPKPLLTPLRHKTSVGRILRATVDHIKCPLSPGFVFSRVSKELSWEKLMYVWQFPHVPQTNYF